MGWFSFIAGRPATGNGRTRQEQYQDINRNLLALRAMLASGEKPYGWNRSQTDTGDPGKPNTVTYALGVLRIRKTMTYGTVGGAAGNIVKAVYEYSDTSGASWEPMADEDGNYVENNTFHASRFICTATTWSNTP